MPDANTDLVIPASLRPFLAALIGLANDVWIEETSGGELPPEVSRLFPGDLEGLSRAFLAHDNDDNPDYYDFVVFKLNGCSFLNFIQAVLKGEVELLLPKE